MSAVVGRKFGTSASDSIDLEKIRVNGEYSETYVVVMTTGTGLAGSYDYTDDINVVASVPGLPLEGSQSTHTPGMYCIGRQFSEVGPAVWEVECRFSNIAPRAQEAGQEPWDLTPTWSWSSEMIEVPLLFDAQDATRPLLNSAGEQLPPITTPESVDVLTISRAELYYDYTVARGYRNRVNSTTFWGAGQNQVLCSDISATQQRKDNVKYWQVEYRFKFWDNNGEGWRVKLLDEGTFYWSGGTKGSGAKLPFGDDAFQQTTGNLNGTGGKNTSLTTPVFISPSFNRYKAADFNALNLGPWSWA